VRAEARVPVRAGSAQVPAVSCRDPLSRDAN
jgi:hypothetical protein